MIRNLAANKGSTKAAKKNIDSTDPLPLGRSVRNWAKGAGKKSLMSIFIWNVRGMNKKKCRRKDVIDHIQKLIPSIAALVETKVK